VAVEGWRRYLAPAAFLLVATVAVLLVHSGLESGHGSRVPTPAGPVASRTPTRGAAATTTAAEHHAAKRYWTVQAGDTFGVISSKTGVPVTTIEQLNPTVKSTSLFIGEKLRIK
jgi:LysM repeat protein